MKYSSTALQNLSAHRVLSTARHRNWDNVFGFEKKKKRCKTVSCWNQARSKSLFLSKRRFQRVISHQVQPIHWVPSHTCVRTENYGFLLFGSLSIYDRIHRASGLHSQPCPAAGDRLSSFCGSPLGHGTQAETGRLSCFGLVFFFKRRLNTQRKVLLQDIRLQLNPYLGIKEYYIILGLDKYDVIFHTRILSQHHIKILSFSCLLFLRELESLMHHADSSLQKGFFMIFFMLD